MLTLPAAALLVAAAPLTGLPARFDRALLIESQRALIVQYSQAREVVSGVYHWATHNVLLDRYLAQQMALDAARNVEATERALTAVTGRLTPEESQRVSREMTTGRDLLAKANRLAAQLRAEAGREPPSRTEFRATTAELYGALALAADVQKAVGHQLGIAPETASKNRIR